MSFYERPEPDDDDEDEMAWRRDRLTTQRRALDELARTRRILERATFPDEHTA